ncbi:hypothetical protein [Floridanema evergladense]|uniref:Uncharacterized protein n=1 Tax=Floridaenema evergladense BLCC-F167 TaxID=3153639 RepID=A0ABV4WCZ1_9CYAN
MPNLGLSLQLQYLSTIGSNTSSGNLPASRLADVGNINIGSFDAFYPITYLADIGNISIGSFDASTKIAGSSDVAIINVFAFDVSASSDTGNININSYDATSKLGIGSDIGNINIGSYDATSKLGIGSDTGNTNVSSYDATVKISITADCGAINSSSYDADWEEDFVAVYSPVSVLIAANSQNSSAFSIPGKIVWIDVPTTVQSRTCTLQTLAADGSSWISTGITWSTSSSVNGLVNSETLAKVSGKTGEGLNNFRLSYDSSVTGNSTHIVRSRT